MYPENEKSFAVPNFIHNYLKARKENMDTILQLIVGAGLYMIV